MLLGRKTKFDWPCFNIPCVVNCSGAGHGSVSDKLREIERRLHEVQDVVQVVDYVLQLLDVMQGNPDQMSESSE